LSLILESLPSAIIVSFASKIFPFFKNIFEEREFEKTFVTSFFGKN